MRTKHLFLATALVASFAACTNDEILDAPQNVAKDGRPAVSDVKLNFTDDADTRVIFGKEGYAWEATDVIGALLMDNVKSTDADKTWLEKYELVSNIHTSYPFTYNKEDKTWGCNTKMLEGNYFFAHPWSSYDGNRKVKYSLLDQEQDGVKGKVVAEAYAKNQFFIGYAQIKAGKQATDVLNDVTMESILGGIQFRIVNTGTQTYHINKLVLKGDGLSSELTFDPKEAAYGESNKWNLKNSTTFNYANYTGNEKDIYGESDSELVYNIAAGDKYERQAALRAVVKAEGQEKSAQLIIKGSAAERALVSTKTDEKAVAYAMIMANPLEITSHDNLLLSIYTDEGMVADIDLTEINSPENGKEYLVVTDSKIEKIAPDVANTIKIQIDDNSFVTPKAMNIYNSDDLLQFIKWNARVAGARAITATLEENVELTKEMVDLLKANTNVDLTIVSANAEDNTLALAKDVPADVLDYGKLTINSDVKVKVAGTLTLTKNSDEVKAIVVAKDATLNVNTVDAVVPAIESEGTLNFGADSKVASSVEIENNGVMNIAEGGDVKAQTTNNGTLNINGYAQNVTNNGEVIMGKNAIMMASVNNEDAVIVTAMGAQVSLTTNNGEVKYVVGAVVKAEGTISAEINGKLTKDTFKDAGCTITKLILKQGITTVADDMSFANVIVSDGAELSVAAKKTLKVTDELTIEGQAKVDGNLVVNELIVKKGADLTIAKDAKMTVDVIENAGIVYNNGTVYTNDTELGAWKYNEPKEKPVQPEQPEQPQPETCTIGDTGANSITTLATKVLAGELVVKDVIIKRTVSNIDFNYETTVEKDKNKGTKYTQGELFMIIANGKKVTIDAENSKNIIGVSSEFGLNFTELELKGDLTISGDKNLEILTVNKVTVANTKTLTVGNGILKVNTQGEAGLGCTVISGTINGLVRSANGLWWNSTKGEWQTTKP